MTVTHCPTNKGSLVCSSDVQVNCGSLFPGHHQDCPVEDARGGWLQCLDLTKELVGSFGCPEDSYGIHRNHVWVQNGCQANFYTCYIPDIPLAQVQTRTLECSNNDKTFKQCKIDKAYLVNNVKLKIPFNKELSCNEGINYGIVADSIFVKDGCVGIFDVEFFPESSAPVTNKTPLPPPRTTTTTRKQTILTTTHFQTTTPVKSDTYSPTIRTTTTNQTSVLLPTQPGGSLVALTVAAVLGIFLVLFIATFAILWFSRRYRCTRRYLERKPDGQQSSEGPSGNIYEEISTQEEVPSAPPVYERQPFITHEFTGHDCSLEQNNNPKNPLGENYFILDPKYRDCHTLPLNISTNTNDSSFEPEQFHSNPPDQRPCYIHHPVARMGTMGSNVSYGHEPIIRMGTFNPKIHQYPLTLGPCLNPNVMHNKQNAIPVFNGKSMRISDSDVDEDGYQKIGTFGPQQKHYKTPEYSGGPCLSHFNSVPVIQQNCNNFANMPHSFSTIAKSQDCPLEQCQNNSNQPLFNTSSC